MNNCEKNSRRWNSFQIKKTFYQFVFLLVGVNGTVGVCHSVRRVRLLIPLRIQHRSHQCSANGTSEMLAPIPVAGLSIFIFFSTINLHCRQSASAQYTVPFKFLPQGHTSFLLISWHLLHTLYFTGLSFLAPSCEKRKVPGAMKPQCVNVTVEPLISWQSRDSISTVAPHCSFGLLNRIAWHNTVEIESRDCQDTSNTLN